MAEKDKKPVVETPFGEKLMAEKDKKPVVETPFGEKLSPIYKNEKGKWVPKPKNSK